MSVMDSVKLLTLTSGGLGLLKPASGTWGSTPPPALFAILMLAAVPLETTRWILLAICLVSCVLCVWWTPWAEGRWGRKDAGQIVIDEVAGMCLPLMVLPMIADPTTVEGFLRMAVWLAVAFVLFRFFDVGKIQPANIAQRLPHGWGVLLDDIIAGGYTACVLLLGVWFGW
jgi:phosphatidylglycerophosphatase A